MPRRRLANGVVVRYPKSARVHASGHEHVSLEMIASRLASLKGYDYAQEFGEHCGEYPHVYFVPDDTLTETQARALSISGEADLFGGVVPYPFVATKLISHPLCGDAIAPVGWSHELGERLGDAVLPGFSAFRIADAQRAGMLLLERGRVRLKTGWGVGGRGQTSVRNPRELQSALAGLDPAAVSRNGVVLEIDLEELATYSVGQIRACGMQMSYHGKQAVTTNGKGEKVYGGSSLTLVRGGFAELLALDAGPVITEVIALAQRYDAAVSDTYAGFIASRRNYDVIHGYDESAKLATGVLEQSWRVGGASPAEIDALDAFLQDPGLNAVRASCVEVYGEHEPPQHAVVHFCDVDRMVGRITKYSMIESHENPSAKTRDPHR